MARAFVRAATGSIGQIVQSMMTLAQFQAQYGTGWVLADGSSAVGTAYATLTGNSTIPDARGMTLRGKNNGRADGHQNPDGDSALGTFQADQFGSHTHDPTNSPLIEGAGGNGHTGWVDGDTTIFSSYSNSTMAVVGGNETRMKNITINHFIRVN